ncbi:arginine N-succinyltransferase [Inhella gelatinilytica]|uniref:Arginine N-succinyltransferase n=1 Tax=Inhella gelatinilytica TaxID=2795030 RepID=A0A931NDH6_9BURK|nr:arginine N-succinyltransferase [Inhella gelatinilytica]MBH9552245.1 arginine N-succinyltransferase [Inhella gelatinilytica]
MSDFLLRPVAPADLLALMRMAAASADGISSLPHDEARLAARIQASRHSFASADDASGEETYLFVLEDLQRGAVVGCSGIAASAGFYDRFYSYRNEFVVHASQALGVTQRMHTLHLCHDLTGCTLLTSFYLAPEYDQGPAAQLLSRARLLFIHAHAERFSSRIAAENPGVVDAQGQSPFWDAVGRRFFGMDYPQAESVVGGRSKAFIADLMPPSPLYVALLPEAAQWALGQLHPVGELPFSILADEGFDADTYVDIFDGGPTVDAPLASLRTVRHARWHTVQPQGVAPPAAGVPSLLVRPERGRFAALLGTVGTHLSAAAVARAEGQAGERWLCAPLDPVEGEA